jgi:DNA-directed RNA polymerase subunit L
MNPQIDNLETKNETLLFTISGVDVCFVNSIRRILLSNIKSFVFRTFPYEESKAEIITNTTRFNNEILKQRLSCIPIHIQDLSFPYQEYIMEVNKTNDTYSSIYITSEDFKVKNIASQTYLSKEETEKIFPKNSMTGDYIKFARLRAKVMDSMSGESLHLTCKFDIGTGSEDGCYSAVSTSTYSNTLDVKKIESSRAEMEAKYKSQGLSNEDVKRNISDWLLLDAKRIFVKNSFDFKVETIGVYENIELVKMACDIGIDKVNNIVKLIEQGDININTSENTLDNCYDIKIVEEFTIGKVLEYILYQKFYEETNILTFCGFKKMHPHDNFSILRLAFVQDVSKENILEYILVSCSEIKNVYQNIKSLF